MLWPQEVSWFVGFFLDELKAKHKRCIAAACAVPEQMMQ